MFLVLQIMNDFTKFAKLYCYVVVALWVIAFIIIHGVPLLLYIIPINLQLKTTLYYQDNILFAIYIIADLDHINIYSPNSTFTSFH